MTVTAATQVEQVNVLRRAQEPAHFLWRGRLYAVLSVHDHWFEAGGARRAGVAPAGSAGGPGTPDASAGGHDRELWRVEAAAGRSAEPAFFDLCLASPGGEWTLTTVQGVPR